MNRIVLKIIFVSILTTFLTSCGLFPNYDFAGMLFGSSPRSNQRFEDSMAYNDSVPESNPDLRMETDDYKVYVVTDLHVDSTWRCLSRWAENAVKDADMVLVLGDMVNGQGNYPHFLEGMRPLIENNVPWYVTVGNHDIYFGQWEQYKSYFGTATYFFTVTTPNACDLYICLDSSDGTLGAKQLKWVRELLARTQKEPFRHRVVFTHTHMFMRDDSQEHTSNYALEETYELTDLFGRYGVDWCLNGHDHSREVTDYKGVTYITVDAMNDAEPHPAYMVARIGEMLIYEFVDLE